MIYILISIQTFLEFVFLNQKKPSYVSFIRKVNYFCMFPLFAYVLEAPFTGGGEWVCKIIRLLCSALQLNADGFTCKLVLHKNLKCILD